MAIGARSQSAKTYLERHYESFPDATLDELINHGLLALRESLQQDKDLSILNTSVVRCFASVKSFSLIAYRAWLALHRRKKGPSRLRLPSLPILLPLAKHPPNPPAPCHVSASHPCTACHSMS